MAVDFKATAENASDIVVSLWLLIEDLETVARVLSDRQKELDAEAAEKCDFAAILKFQNFFEAAADGESVLRDSMVGYFADEGASEELRRHVRGFFDDRIGDAYYFVAQTETAFEEFDDADIDQVFNDTLGDDAPGVVGDTDGIKVKETHFAGHARYTDGDGLNYAVDPSLSEPHIYIKADNTKCKVSAIVDADGQFVRLEVEEF